jgi:Ca-activated chloride channel family protein
VSGSDLFARPELAPLLLVAPLAWLALRFVAQGRARALAQSVGPRAAADAERAQGGAPRLRRRLIALGLLCATLALLGPLFGEVEHPVAPRGADVALVLDVSRSMLARDADGTRLQAAQREIDALARRAAGDRLALIVFAGSARRLVPLTADLASFRALAEGVGPDSVLLGGSDPAAGLDEALAALGGGGHGDVAAIVLLSDGESLTGDALAAAQRCAARGVPVHAVGFGSRAGSKIALSEGGREEFLKDRAGREVVTSLAVDELTRLAGAAGGRFVEATASPHPLLELFDAEIAPRARRAFAADERRNRANRYQWPLAGAFICWFVAALARSRRPS